MCLLRYLCVAIGTFRVWINNDVVHSDESMCLSLRAVQAAARRHHVNARDSRLVSCGVQSGSSFMHDVLLPPGLGAMDRSGSYSAAAAQRQRLLWRLHAPADVVRLHQDAVRVHAFRARLLSSSPNCTCFRIVTSISHRPAGALSRWRNCAAERAKTHAANDFVVFARWRSLHSHRAFCF